MTGKMFALTIATTVILVYAGSATPPCRELSGAKAQQALAYLETSRQELNSACIVHAIRQLGNQHYTPAAYVLATYLDFRMPGTENKDSEHKLHIERIPWLGEKYPAADALFEIGKPASPSLVRVIGETSISLLRDNALEVLLAIHSEDMPDAVMMLSQASRSALDLATSIRLLDAAKKHAARCPGELRVRCEDALFEHARN